MQTCIDIYNFYTFLRTVHVGRFRQTWSHVSGITAIINLQPVAPHVFGATTFQCPENIHFHQVLDWHLMRYKVTCYIILYVFRNVTISEIITTRAESYESSRSSFFLATFLGLSISNLREFTVVTKRTKVPFYLTFKTIPLCHGESRDNPLRHFRSQPLRLAKELHREGWEVVVHSHS